MKYDFKDDELNGFYTWNKSKFLIGKDDKRYKRCQNHKKQYGFSQDECWNLYFSVCIFLLPRLKAFRKMTCGHPCCIESHEKWLEILDKMIWSFEEIQKDNIDDLLKIEDDKKRKKATDKYYAKIQEGLHLFADYFWNLWW